MPACHVKYPLKAWFSDSLYILRAVHVKKQHSARLKGWGYFTRWVCAGPVHHSGLLMFWFSFF
jgi:hypothetical protein